MSTHLAWIFHKKAQTSCKSLIEWKVGAIHSGKTTRGLLMLHSTPEQLRFPPIAGYTVRADFEGGALSSDFGALLLRGIDCQIGLTARLAAAVQDKRHPSYIDHPLRDLFAQRIYQIASGYADGHDANSLRHKPRHNVRYAGVHLTRPYPVSVVSSSNKAV